MRKVIFPVAAGGAPFNNERYGDVLGTDIWTGMESILAGIQTSLPGYSANGAFGIVLSGCQLTGTGPYGMTSGVVYLNQQLMFFPGFTATASLLNGSYNLQADPSNPYLTSKTFADGVTRNFITENRCQILGGAPPGSGHYVSFTTPSNPSGVNTLSGAIAATSGVSAAIAVETAARIAADALKQNIAQPAFTTATLINGWAVVAGYPTPKYRIRNDGNAEIVIYGLDAAAASSGVPFNLPAGFANASTFSMIFPGFITTSSLISTTVTFMVDSTPRVQVIGYVAGTKIHNMAILYDPAS